jgi:hypothetical protein
MNAAVKCFNVCLLVFPFVERILDDLFVYVWMSFLSTLKKWAYIFCLFYTLWQEIVENGHLQRTVSPISGNWIGLWWVQSYIWMPVDKFQALFSARSHASSLDLLLSGNKINHPWILTIRRNVPLNLIKTVLNRPNLSFNKPDLSHVCTACHTGHCTSDLQSSETLI